MINIFLKMRSYNPERTLWLVGEFWLSQRDYIQFAARSSTRPVFEERAVSRSQSREMLAYLLIFTPLVVLDYFTNDHYETCTIPSNRYSHISRLVHVGCPGILTLSLNC